MRVQTHVHFFCIVALFLCAPLCAFAATDVTSDITSDTEWTLGGSPYVVSFSGNDAFSEHYITVPAGATLTIDPGVVVKFDAYNGLEVNGTLRAIGTANNPIIFTSLEDDTAGGDTNGDGSDTTPTDQQWMHLQFNAGSTGAFDHAAVRYGGAFILFAVNTGIQNSGGTLTVNHTTLTHNGLDGLGQHGGHTTLSNSLISDQSIGIRMSGGELDISDTRIYNNSMTGIDHYGDGTLSVTHSEIDHNGTGIGANAQGSIIVSDSSIHDNNSFGVDNQSEITIDARNNWWGDANGPRQPVEGVEGQPVGVQGDVAYSPWLASDPFAPDPCATPGACVSNVLFLPGIEGSRLYEGVGCIASAAEEKLWDPVAESNFAILRGAGDDKVKKLFLDSTGESVCSDVYAKADGIIDTIHGNNIYKSFIDEMKGLVTDGTIADWKAAAYDWRFSLTDLLNNGAERGGKIFYEESTSTPYIEQTLRALAGSSKTGKVTIVAHSNGGLVAKALLNKLGSEASKSLVDKVILVGAPQSGAPLGMGALLYGLDQGISSWSISILHTDVARELAINSPMAYHLLPSEDYLTSIASDANHPLARFAGEAYSKEISAYGSTISNTDELDNFLLAKEGGREKPKESDVTKAEIGNATLIDYANGQHAALDNWAPPAGIEVDQIAGWGADTIAGIDFYTSPKGKTRQYDPIITEDGDGVVPVPSALMMATSTSVKSYWLNLFNYNDDTNSNRRHRDIFEIPSLEDFIKNIIKNSANTLPIYISTSQPSSLTDNKKLIFFLHSPLTLELTDSSGNVTGLAEDDSMTQDIPDSTYGEFGEVKYIIVPEGSYTLAMHGQDSGTFSLDMQEISGGVVTASSTIANVPTTPSTLASLTISGGLNTISALTVDENGDGGNMIIIAPKVGETVNYEPPIPVPEPAKSSAGGGGTWAVSIPASTPIVTATTTNIFATTTQMTATSTPIGTIPMKPIQEKKKAPTAVALPPKVSIPIPQTASVYDGASQQPLFAKLGMAVYNGLHGFWLALIRFF